MMCKYLRLKALVQVRAHPADGLLHVSPVSGQGINMKQNSTARKQVQNEILNGDEDEVTLRFEVVISNVISAQCMTRMDKQEKCTEVHPFLSMGGGYYKRLSQHINLDFIFRVFIPNHIA